MNKFTLIGICTFISLFAFSLRAEPGDVKKDTQIVGTHAGKEGRDLDVEAYKDKYIKCLEENKKLNAKQSSVSGSKQRVVLNKVYYDSSKTIQKAKDKCLSEIKTNCSRELTQVEYFDDGKNNRIINGFMFCFGICTN